MQTAIAPLLSSNDHWTAHPQRPGHPPIPSFADCFSDEAILRQLCRWRIRRARQRNEHLFLHRIRARPQHGPALEERMFPPRRLWHSRRPRMRDSKAGDELNSIALERTILATWNTTPCPGWALDLHRFVSSIQQRVSSVGPFRFERPRIRAKEKEQGDKAHRPIADFPLDDKIIASLVARYLRQCVDSVLDPASMAFRGGRSGQPAPRHHDAVEELLAFRERHSGKRLYVAECDIQGFFDCVDHALARTACKDVIAAAESVRDGEKVDDRARAILESYMECYTFPRSVLQEAEPRLKDRHPGAFFKWPRGALLRFHKDPEAVAIGLPQGGALSAFIANCLLHRVDVAVRGPCAASDVKYLRFCDDMIMVSPSMWGCWRAFRRYRRVMDELRLPIHPPQWHGKYGQSFWEGKSKPVYRWGAPFLSFRRSPWIQFVGYQIRYDGLIRIRKTSYEKHVKKIVDVVDEVVAHVRLTVPHTGAAVRKTSRQIMHRVHMRLVTMAVGRPRLHNPVDAPLPRSWCAGFECLYDQPFLSRQLKGLDRHRERQLRRLGRALGMLFIATSEGTGGKRARALPYYGRPFSYFARFRRAPLAVKSRSNLQ